MLAAVEDRTALRPDLLGIALMIAGLGLGLLVRSLVPAADACDRNDWGPVLLAASVVAFGAGFVRCLSGRARRVGTATMVAVTAIMLAIVLDATLAAPPAYCG
jgi:hypothetical protein